ncbi:MAG: hypothetical protein ACRDOE_17910, partial [Streptosporangiaceae bacterium]
MASRRVLTDSPFDTVEKHFDLLGTPPHALVIDATSLGGLPDRAIALGELKAMLLHPTMAFEVRDAVIGALVARARVDGGAWAVALVGVLLPGLRRAVWPLVQMCPGKAADIEAEALAALLAAAAGCEPDRPRLASRLCWLARNAANRLLSAELAERARPANDPVSAAPRQPWGHPDLVLDKAVRAGVVGAADAELIGATRLGEMTLPEAAAARGLPYKAAERRRHRAEAALVAWLRDGFVAERPVPAGSKG